MIITISGTPGSGKSTVAKILAQELKLHHYSTGDFMREMALERGITLEELGEIAKTDPSIDKELDDRQIKLGEEKDNFIIDGRLSFHFIPNSIKIYLDVDIEIGAKRILKDSIAGLRKEEQNANLQEAAEKIKRRINVEKERYEKYYGINPHDKSHYDLVADTSAMNAQEVVQEIIEFVKKQKDL